MDSAILRDTLTLSSSCPPSHQDPLSFWAIMFIPVSWSQPSDDLRLGPLDSLGKQLKSHVADKTEELRIWNISLSVSFTLVYNYDQLSSIFEK